MAHLVVHISMIFSFGLMSISPPVFSNDGPLCRSSFFTLHKDRYLPNHEIHSTIVTSHFECSMECLAQSDCQSWNMVKANLRYRCGLNNVTMETASMENTYLLVVEGAEFGQRHSRESTTPEQISGSIPQITYFFTSLEAQGSVGPSGVTGYQGTTLEGQVTLDNGVQEWTVPHTGTYEIEARGASGANGTCAKTNYTNGWQLGGLGAKLKGKFKLINGTVLKILVAQTGLMNTAFGDRPGGGGGGTFVTYVNNTPLIIAGGGGGGGGCIALMGMADGDPGQKGEIGSQCNSTVKQGGVLCPEGVGNSYAGAGAGFLGNGKFLGAVGSQSYAFVNGGRGGRVHVLSNGGFGGGGFGWLFGGGGGGYSGGGIWVNSTNGVAGGGGSLNNGYDTEAGLCESRGDGSVKIDFFGEEKQGLLWN